MNVTREGKKAQLETPKIPPYVVKWMKEPPLHVLFFLMYVKGTKNKKQII